MCVFAVLFMLDYLLTYYGISKDLISEGNPLMVWLFELPFFQGLIIRLLMCIIFISLLYVGREAKVYHKAKKGIILAYSMVMVMHLVWIGLYRLRMY